MRLSHRRPGLIAVITMGAATGNMVEHDSYEAGASGASPNRSVRQPDEPDDGAGQPSLPMSASCTIALKIYVLY
jgi:hypothetical protein